jgi:hypothetical protein
MSGNQNATPGANPMITPPSGVDWALYIASQGWRVFPIRPGFKEPYAREGTATALGVDPDSPAGVHHARDDEASIRMLWKGERANAWIGLAMGSGRLAIDIDEKAKVSGSATIARNGWVMPTTASQRTPSGGAHMVFNVGPGANAPTDAGRLGDGLDRRGDGGYIVLYDPALVTLPVAPAPEWSLTSGTHSREQRTPLGTVPAPSFELACKALTSVDPNELDYDHWRNHTAAFRQAATGTASDDVIRLRWNGWSAQYLDNDPTANDKLWRSLTNGTNLGWAFLRDYAVRHGELSDDDRARLLGLKGIIYPSPPASAARPVNSVDNFFIVASDLEYRPPEYHITDLIETDALVVLFGDSATGKSFIAIDMACCVSTGNSFHGHQVHQGPVFYIAGEGRNGIRRRLTAWEEKHEFSLANAPLYVSRAAAQFLDGGSAVMVSNAIENLIGQHGTPRLIVVDTLARNFGSGDENSQKDMTTFIVAMDSLRVRFPGSTIIIVHHSGHGDKDRARGSSVLKGAVDAEFKTSKTEEQIKLQCHKMKDGSPPRSMEFRLEPIGFSAALTYLGEPTGTSRALRADQQAAMDSFIECNVDVVTTDQWRDRFYAKRPGSLPEANQKAFKRARDQLVKQTILKTDDKGLTYRQLPSPGMMPPRGED